MDYLSRLPPLLDGDSSPVGGPRSPTLAFEPDAADDIVPIDDSPLQLQPIAQEPGLSGDGAPALPIHPRGSATFADPDGGNVASLPAADTGEWPPLPCPPPGSNASAEAALRSSLSEDWGFHPSRMLGRCGDSTPTPGDCGASATGSTTRLHQGLSFSAVEAWRGRSTGASWAPGGGESLLLQEQPPPSPLQLQPHQQQWIPHAGFSRLSEAALAAWPAGQSGYGADSAAGGLGSSDPHAFAPKPADLGLLDGNAPPSYVSPALQYNTGRQYAPKPLNLPAGGACNLEALLEDMDRLALELEVWGEGGGLV